MLKFGLAIVSILAMNFAALAEERDCSQAAASAVARMDMFRTKEVNSVKALTKKNSKNVVTLIESRRAIDLGVSPGSKAQILNDLKNGSADTAYFLVKANRDEFFLVITDKDSCAPYNPIALK